MSTDVYGKLAGKIYIYAIDPMGLQLEIAFNEGFQIPSTSTSKRVQSHRYVTHVFPRRRSRRRLNHLPS